MELNPNHPVTALAHDSWHKMVAILMLKYGAREVDIFRADVERLEAEGGLAVILHAKADRLTLRLVSEEEGTRLAREAGGLVT